jgi:polar amino acid transport system permease protein
LLFTVFYGFPVVFKLALDPFTAAVVTMGFYQAAFMTQIVRAGIESVPLGQSSAADALGLTYIQKMRNIVMPQALRVILPGAVGLLVSAIKDSSLASVIGLFELTRTALAIRNITLSNWDVLGTLLLLYVVINSIVSVAGGLLERRLAPSENQRQVLDAVLLQIELRQR